jgi:hypothetical protein
MKMVPTETTGEEVNRQQLHSKEIKNGLSAY